MVRAVTPIPFVKARFFDRCGKPLAGGKVYTYEANTTTPKVTYKDPYGLTPNTNPIILDAAGEADIYLDGTYRIRITDCNDVLINDVEKIGSWFSDNLQDTLDNISGAMDDALKPMLQNLDEAINTAAAAGAGANGWTALLVADESGLTQQQINNNLSGLDSIADMLGIVEPKNGQRVNVKGVRGGTFEWQADSTDAADNGITFAVSGVATGRWVRTNFEIVYPEMFGAVGDGVTDDYLAIQTAVLYCAKNSKALLFGDSVYVCNSKVVIDSAVTYFKTVRLIGTYRGTGSAAGYAPNIANSGTTILVNDNDFIEVQIKRWFNENIILDGFAIVNTAATVARSAIKLSKGDFANYPEENRYITNNMFNNIATYGFERSIVFSGNYTKAMAGTSYLWNYFGPTELNNFYPYNGKHGIVLENATLNRLSVNRSLFFNLSGGAIVTTEKDANSHESVLMCQLNFVHFEDCRGIFRLGMGAAPSDGAKNHVTMIDVTREACGMYDGKNGSPYGIVNNSTIHILGRHDFMGYLETSLPDIGENSEVFSNTKLQLRIVPNGAKSLSPDKINVASKSVSVNAKSSKIVSVTSYDVDNPFDITVKVIINGGTHGYKELKAFGVLTAGSYRVLTETGELHSTVTMQKSSSNSTMLEVIIANGADTSISAAVEVTNNATGIQLSIV